MEKLSAFYFSGTGNTKYITEKLCTKLKEKYEIQIFDITETQKAARSLRRYAVIRVSDIRICAAETYGEFCL